MNEKNFEYIKGAIYFGLVGLALVVFSVLFESFIRKTEEEKRERIAVQEIAIELEYYTFIQASGRKHMSEVDKAAGRLLSAIRNPGNLPPDGEVLLDLQRLTWLFHAGTPRTKYSSLNASGDFDLIRSPELRKQLTHFQANIERLVIFEGLQGRFIDRQLRPYLNKHTDRTSLEAYLAIPKRDSLVVRTYPSPFRTDLPELLADREFANLLVDLKAHTLQLMLPYHQMGSDIERIKALIVRDYPAVKWEPYHPF